MRQRLSPRRIPNRPNYIRVEIPTRPAAHRTCVMRIPNTLLAGRMAPLLVDIQVQKELAEDQQGRTLHLATLSVEVAAALVGVCWFHPDLDLADSWREYDDLREFGSMVHEDLTEGIPKPGYYRKAREAWDVANNRYGRALVAKEEAQALVDSLLDDDAPDPEDPEEHAHAVEEARREHFKAEEECLDALSSRMDVAGEFFQVPPFDHREISQLFAPLVRPTMDLVIGGKEIEDRADF